jgi:hypothetical protein
VSDARWICSSNWWYRTAVAKSGAAGRPSLIARANSRYSTATFLGGPAGTDAGIGRTCPGTGRCATEPSGLLMEIAQSVMWMPPGAAGRRGPDDADPDRRLALRPDRVHASILSF